MKPPPECVVCDRKDRPEPVAERIVRCRSCGTLLPLPRQVGRPAASAALRGLAHVAPGGVLRGKYRLIELLGEGAHGVSYFAWHQYLGHACVVKLLPRGGRGRSDAATVRLRNEARAGYRVNDPNVVRVLDCDVVRGVWYFVMEYVDGIDLGSILENGLCLPWQQAVQVGLDAASGIAAIQRAGLVHRDIKPANLILGTDGRVRVADLGVARLAHDRREPAEPSGAEMVGTLTYAAPEMFVSGVTVGPTADLYSLGASLYHLVTGRPPHDTRQVFRRLIDLQTRPVEWPQDGGVDVPKWFSETILDLLAIEPESRVESTAALIGRLTTPTATPPPAAVAPVDALEPRGVGVLAFRNDGGFSGDDWLGYALANHIWRALTELPGIYVAGQDALATMLNRLEVVDPLGEPGRLLEAGRLVGAGTLLTGRFRREGETLHAWAEVLRAGGGATETVARVRGPLARLSELEATLFDGVLRALELPAASGGRSAAAAHSPALEARERFILGKQAFFRGDYEEAIGLGEEAVQLDAQFAEAIGFIGVCLARLGRYAAAEAQHRAQEALAGQWGDARLAVEASANLGVMNYFRGDYEAAEEYLQRAASLAEARALATEHARICNNLGFVLMRRGRLQEAEQAFLRAIETHRTYGALESLIGPYNGSGNVLVEEGRYEEARDYYRRALNLAEEVGDRTSVGMTHTHLGRCAVLQERFADAQHEFTMALNTLEETRFWNGLARAYEHMADMNMRLANHDEAIRCADKRIELARQHSNARMEAAAWRQKAEALQQVGRTEEAAACMASSRKIGRGVPARPDHRFARE